MKKILLILLCFFSITSFCYSQNCKNYKNGKFKLEDKELGVTYIIERKGNIQTERKIGEDRILDFNVTWIDDCTYILKSSKETSEFLKTGVDLIVQIKKVKGRGLMLGLEFDFEVASLRKKLIYEHHIFTGGSSNKNLIRILPPLTVQKSHFDTFFNALKIVIENL